MYQQYRGKETYFWHAQRLARDGGRYHAPVGAFAKIISGLSDLQDTGYSPGWAPAEGAVPPPDTAPRGHAAGAAVRSIVDPATGLRLVTDPRLGLARVSDGPP
jgi:hypothetical protein